MLTFPGIRVPTIHVVGFSSSFDAMLISMVHRSLPLASAMAALVSLKGLLGVKGSDLELRGRFKTLYMLCQLRLAASESYTPRRRHRNCC